MAQRINVFLLVFMVSACCEATPERRSNTGDVSLSINIPTLSLSELLTKSDHQTAVPEARENIKPKNDSRQHEESQHEEKDEKSQHEEKDEKGDGGKTLDLAKLLSSGKPLSIKSTETSTMGETGKKEKDVKEVSISTLGAQGVEDEGPANSQNAKDDGQTVEKLVSALKTQLFNSSKPKEAAHLNADENPSSGLMNELELPKEIKGLKGKGKAVAEDTTTAAADQSDASSEPKETPESNQIALVPVSVPASLISQLQGAANMGNVSGNSTNIAMPNLSSLLKQHGGNKTTHHDNATTESKQDNNPLAKEAALSNATQSNNSLDDAGDEKSENNDQEKEEKKEKDDEHELVSKNHGTSIVSGKNGQLLLVLPKSASSSRRDRLTKERSRVKKKNRSRCRRCRCKHH